MKVITLGSAARQVLARKAPAQVFGITSRGMFLQSGLDGVLFLSAGPERSPLTLNLDGSPGLFREQTGDPVAIQDSTLWFPKSQLSLPFSGADVWTPPQAGGAPLRPAERLTCLDAVLRRLQDPGDLLAPGQIDELSRALQAGQAARAAGLLQPLLGRGPGLTPAGDDLILGLLLALNRWGFVLAPEFPVEALNTLLVQDARSRTIALSASLIACAAQGQADERLIRGLDGVVTGESDTQAVARCFANWGSTSGASVFVGICVVAISSEPTDSMF